MIRYAADYIREFVHLTMEMAPWLLLGFIFAGILHVYMPEGSIRRIMGGRNLKSVVYAALLGIPLPLCSCGVIPTGISFYKEGASKGATVSFLISTPQTGVDSILATYSLLGLPFALLRPVVAFFSGILGGTVTNMSSRSDEPAMPDTEQRNRASDGKNKLGTMARYAFYEFLMDIAKWLLIGLAVAALIALILPDSFFTTYLHNELLSMLVVLAASVPIYVCATGSIPIAAVLMMKGLSPGAALVFLMAGPATNTATMAVIGKAIDKKTLAVYMITIIGSAMMFGYLTNLLLPGEWFAHLPGMHGEHQHEILPTWLKVSSAVILAGLIVHGYIRRYMENKQKHQITDMAPALKEIKVRVEGMTCNHCKANVEKSIMKLEGVEGVNADPDTSEVVIRGSDIRLDSIRTAVEDIGYSYKGSAG